MDALQTMCLLPPIDGKVVQHKVSKVMYAVEVKISKNVTVVANHAFHYKFYFEYGNVT
jgi:hypothetical protein